DPGEDLGTVGPGGRPGGAQPGNGSGLGAFPRRDAGEKRRPALPQDRYGKSGGRPGRTNAGREKGKKPASRSRGESTGWSKAAGETGCGSGRRGSCHH